MVASPSRLPTTAVMFGDSCAWARPRPGAAGALSRVGPIRSSSLSTGRWPAEKSSSSSARPRVRSGGPWARYAAARARRRSRTGCIDSVGSSDAAASGSGSGVSKPAPASAGSAETGSSGRGGAVSSEISFSLDMMGSCGAGSAGSEPGSVPRTSASLSSGSSAPSSRASGSITSPTWCVPSGGRSGATHAR